MSENLPVTNATERKAKKHYELEKQVYNFRVIVF